MKKTKKQLLRDEADKQWSIACFRKWGDSCTVCGKPATQTHHFFPKGQSAYLRYDVNNGVPLCFYCHILRIHRKNEPEPIVAISNSRGKEWYDNLARLKKEGQNKSSYLSVKYYEDIIKKLKETK
jgi:hypothetical protein